VHYYFVVPDNVETAAAVQNCRREVLALHRHIPLAQFQFRRRQTGAERNKASTAFDSSIEIKVQPTSLHGHFMGKGSRRRVVEEVSRACQRSVNVDSAVEPPGPTAHPDATRAFPTKQNTRTNKRLLTDGFERTPGKIGHKQRHFGDR
jgi:hypothetical protein